MCIGQRLRGAAALLTLAAAVVIADVAQAAELDTTLISRADTATGAKANGASGLQEISADGRYVAFSSAATNLDGDDTNADNDIYVRDLQTNETTLVSRADTAGGAKANASSFSPSISADGRYVAFSTAATNLDADDTTGAEGDVYVRDLVANETILVSRADGATGAKQDGGFAGDPVISDDGDRVVFHSDANNLDSGDTTGADQQAYVRDLSANETTLVSREDGVDGPKSNGEAVEVSISPDGRYVVFSAGASNLDPDAGLNGHIYVRDLQTAQIELVSRNSDDEPADGGSLQGDVSEDGEYVAFTSLATNLDPADTGPVPDVYVRNLVTGVTVLASRPDGTGGPGNDDSFAPKISNDGRYVSFTTLATNLDPADTDTGFDVLVRDLAANDTALVGRADGASGAKGNAGSELSSISGDGSVIAFDSLSTNLDPADTDALRDIFVREPASAGALLTLTVAKSGTGTGTVTSAAGINCGTTCSIQRAQGSSETLTANPTTGSTFAGWSGCDSQTGNQCTVTVNGDRTVTASFNGLGVAPGAAQRSVSLTASKSKVTKGKKVTLSGAIDAGPAVACESGEQVQLQRAAKTGNTFLGFSSVKTDGSGKFSVKVKVTKTFSYRANLVGSLDCSSATSSPKKVTAKKKK